MNGTGGRNSGGGRGRSGGRMASNNNRGAESLSSNTSKSRQDRKAARRSKQLEAMEKKAKEEDAYFRQCQQDALRNSKKKSNGASDSKTQQELFAKQGTHGINFNKYDQIKVEVKLPPGSNSYKIAVMKSFEELDFLTPQLQTNISLMNYKLPTPIQRNAIPLSMAGEDLMCCAQTGSGKTCAFLLPVCAALAKTNGQKHHPHEPANPRCVVLAPTRELASQIELEAQKLTHCIPSVSPVVVYGGAPTRPQLRALAYGSASTHALVVVATPGRLTDFVDRNIIELSHVQYLVLDEADRMLDMGFMPQITKIVMKSGMTPKSKRQTLMFSATFPPQIQQLASEFLRPYVWIAVGRVGSTTDSITQVLVKATPDKRKKLALVVDALQSGPDGRTLIFVQKKRTATWLKKQLNKGGPDDGQRFTPIPAMDIHGDRSQSQREAALESFRSGKCRVLVATDVAARGLDIAGVDHVINMDLPTAREEFDSYTHRIGRTGRAGHEGLATSLFVPGDDPKTGNGKIASLLIEQLREAGQKVPDWLEEQVAGGGGGMPPAKRKQQFGGTDVRRSGSKGGRGSNGKRPAGNSPRASGRNGGGRGGRGARSSRGS